jgi:uncharacterized membrane protein required for colicin V production
MPNIIDGMLIAIIAGATFWGWKAGFLRLLVALTAALAGCMVASLLYQPIGYFLSDFSFVGVLAFYHALSYLFVLTLTAGLWFFAIHKIYPYTRLVDPSADRLTTGLDNLGGMFLGLLLGILLSIATIGVAELLAYSRWPVLEAAGSRSALHGAVQQSLIVRGLFSEVPDLMEHVSHWVPGIQVARDGRIQT